MNDFQRRVGIGQPSRAFNRRTGQTERRNVIIEEGPRRGSVGGHVDIHWSGRQDATVTPNPVKVRPTTHE